MALYRSSCVRAGCPRIWRDRSGLASVQQLATDPSVGKRSSPSESGNRRRCGRTVRRDSDPMAQNGESWRAHARRSLSSVCLALDTEHYWDATDLRSLGQLLRAILPGFGRADCFRDHRPERLEIRSSQDRVHIFRSLRGFIYNPTACISFCNGSIRSEVASSWTNVLGDNDNGCAGAGDCRIAFRTFGSVASRLLTLMLIGFGLLVWLPAPFSDPHKLINWAGNAQNLAITGAAWIVMDFLSQSRAAEPLGISRSSGSGPGQETHSLRAR